MVLQIGRMSMFVHRDIATICWKGCGSLLRSVSVMAEGHVPGTTELVGFGKSGQGDKVLDRGFGAANLQCRAGALTLVS